MKSVAAYIDGYNLYHGLKDRSLKRFYWLDIPQLIQTFIEKEYHLNRIYYFTSPSVIPESRKRQNTYIEALQTTALIKQIDFRVVRGRFMPEDVRCQNCNDVIRCPRPECGEIVRIHHEKETDVNIAVQMISDAYEDDVFETAFLITGDSDQAGTIRTIKRFFGNSKRVIVIFPPNRHSNELESLVPCLHISIDKLAKCQLPERIEKADGYILCRPAQWR